MSWADFLKKGAAAVRFVAESVEQSKPDYVLQISLPVRAHNEEVIKDIQRLQTQIEAFGPTIVQQIVGIFSAISLAGEPSVRLEKVEKPDG